jgi:hypothetical protein
MFLLVIGTRTFHWGSDRAADVQTCPNCGYSGQFIQQKAIRTLALFFVIPIFPLGKIRHLRQCPSCNTRYAA